MHGFEAGNRVKNPISKFCMNADGFLYFLPPLCGEN
jgi:hypothetical protein